MPSGTTRFTKICFFHIGLQRARKKAVFFKRREKIEKLSQTDSTKLCIPLPKGSL